jgi:CBS domain-containing protein
MFARDVMTPDVLLLHPSDTLAVAARKMVDRGVAGAPVVGDKGELVGILSEADILDHLKAVTKVELPGKYQARTAHSLFLFVRFAEEGREDVQEVFARLRSSMVKEAMTSDVVTARPGATLEYVAALMIRHNINRVPIIDEGRVLGIITRLDVVRVIGGVV